MVNIFRAWRVFKISFVLLAFAIILKGINTQEGNYRTKENQDMILRVKREKLLWHQTNLYHDGLTSIIGVYNRWKDVILFSKHS